MDEDENTRNLISGGNQQGPVLQGRDFIQPIFVTNQVVAAPTPVARVQLPALTIGFTGRETELAQLAMLLDPAADSGAVVVSAVAGLAGVGKTTLAVHAGHAAVQRGWFDGGVLFINLHGYDEISMPPEQALDALLRGLGKTDTEIPRTIDDRTALYREELAKLSKRMLVIVDNASSEAQVRPLLPGMGPHKVLVTSRHTLAGIGARLVDVTVLDETASISLLKTALQVGRPDDDRISDDPQAAVQLARVCGGLPLALQITAALLKVDPTLRSAELAEQFSIEKSRLRQLHYDDGSGSGELSVAAAFELSYQRLTVISAWLFRLLPVNPGSDASTAAVASLADLPVREVRRGLVELARAHLIEAAPGAVGRWRMHDLLRLYAQQLSDTHADADGRMQAQNRLFDYYLRIAELAHEYFYTPLATTDRAEFSSRDEVTKWLDAEDANLKATATMAADIGRDQIALRLFTALAECFAWRGKYNDSRTVGAERLNAARRLGDQLSEAQAWDSIGHVLLMLWKEDLDDGGGEWEDKWMLENAFTALRNAIVSYRNAQDRLNEAITLIALGNARRRHRVFIEWEWTKEAITAYRDAAAIFREIANRKGEGIALHNQGIALYNLGITLKETRKFEEAITVYQDAAAIFREADDRHDEGVALNNLGDVLREARRFEEAISAHQAAAAIFREADDRHDEGVALNNLELDRTAKEKEHET